MSASATAGESEDKNDLILAKLSKLNRIEDCCRTRFFATILLFPAVLQLVTQLLPTP